MIAVTAAISPYVDVRNEIRAAIEQEGRAAFVEVFAHAPLPALVARDVKGLYKKALAGEIKHFTGVSDPYEAPANPDVTALTSEESVEESARKILAHLAERGLIAQA